MQRDQAMKPLVQVGAREATSVVSQLESALLESCDGDTREQSQPPVPTAKELARDNILLFMSRPCWGWLAFIHLLWIIGDGAFFVFLVLNWQALSRAVGHGVVYSVGVGVTGDAGPHGGAHARCAVPCSRRSLLTPAAGDVRARGRGLRTSRLVVQRQHTGPQSLPCGLLLPLGPHRSLYVQLVPG